MDTLKLYLHKASGVFSYRLKGLFPSLEFSISERKFFLALVDLLIVLSGMIWYFQITGSEGSYLHILKQNTFGLAYGIFIFTVLANIFNFYNLETASKTRKMLPLIFFVGVSFTVIYLLTPLITPVLPDKRLYILGFITRIILGLAFWRIFYIYVIHSPAFYKNMLVITSGNISNTFITDIQKKIEGDNQVNGYRILKIFKLTEENSKNIGDQLNRIVKNGAVDSIVVLDRDHNHITADINKVLISSIQNGVNVQTFLQLYEELEEAIPLNLAGRNFYNIFPISRTNSNYFYHLWNRGMDILSALLGLSITVLLIPLIALINFFTSKGPLFYSQLRVGKGGKEYKMIKFRSMVVDAEKQGAKMAVKNDARITKFGKILRKTRIDELPQFLAVLKGDMSLIGPRPERKLFVDQLAEQIPFYNARHMIKPGITGWAQVKYPYGENLEDSYNKLEYDLYYIKNRSVTIDIRIIIKTINTVIFSKGQ